jgi:hypothetical protein
MNASIPFASPCPSCGRQRLQDGYTRRALLRLLNTGAPIKGYCIACDAFWPVSDIERVVIAEDL